MSIVKSSDMVERRMLYVLLLAFVAACGAQRNVIRVSLCEQVEESASLSASDVFEINGDDSRCSDQISGLNLVAYRVIVSSNDSSEAFPLVMTMQQISNSELQTVSLPFQGQRFGTAKFLSVNHVVCPDLNSTQPTNGTLLLLIDIFSTSPTGVDYTLEVQPIPMFEVSFGRRSTMDITVGPATTQLHYFQSTESERDRIIEVNAGSVNDSCAILSIQTAQCPVILDDLSDTVTSRSMFQTMNQSATISFMNVEVGDAYFILLTRVEDGLCDPGITTEPSGTFQDDTEFSKVITITLITKPAVKDFGAAIVLPLLCFLAVAVGVTPFAIFCSPVWKPVKWFEVRYPKCTKFWDPIFSAIFNKTIFECMRSAWRKCCILCGKAESFDVTDRESSPSPLAASGDIVKCSRCQNKVDRFLTDTYKQPHSVLRERYQVYLWSVIAVFVFYVLPAFQVLLAIVDAVLNTGDQDLCYYNFKCSHPVTLGSFLRDYKSFNSIWSNILLILCGLLFIFIVSIRDARYKRLKRPKSEASDVEAGQGTAPEIKHNGSAPGDQEDADIRPRRAAGTQDQTDSGPAGTEEDEKITTGIPQLPGVFYALGFALMGEGFMSLIYHICPTNRNFQFDTTFMFIIGGLLMIKIFQFRHPDRNKNAHIAYVMFAFVVFITLLGIYLDSRSPAVRTVLLLTLLFIFMTFLVSLYHYHEIWNREILKKMLKGIRCLEFREVRRFWRLMIAFIINLFLVIVFIVAGGVGISGIGFASAILYLFIINAGYFGVVYVFTKMLYRERTLTLLPVVYVVVGTICMAAALVFFQMNTYDSNMSPSASRELNEGCILVDFYDNHDLWHFLAAFGLFFLFLFLLTIDDGVMDVPHEKLHVF